MSEFSDNDPAGCAAKQHLATLSAQFPAFSSLLGADRFGELVHAFFQSGPALPFALHHVGIRFAVFVANHPNLRSEPVLSDLAAFEAALSSASQYADPARLQKADLSTQAFEKWNNLHLRLHPSVRFVTLLWDTPTIRRAHDDRRALPQPNAYREPVTWMVWYLERQARYRALEPAEACALSTLADGHDFAQLCERLCRWVGEQHVAQHAADMVSRWLADGVLAEARAI